MKNCLIEETTTELVRVTRRRYLVDSPSDGPVETTTAGVELAGLKPVLAKAVAQAAPPLRLVKSA